MEQELFSCCQKSQPSLSWQPSFCTCLAVATSYCSFLPLCGSDSCLCSAISTWSRSVQSSNGRFPRASLHQELWQWLCLCTVPQLKHFWKSGSQCFSAAAGTLGSASAELAPCLIPPASQHLVTVLPKLPCEQPRCFFTSPSDLPLAPLVGAAGGATLAAAASNKADLIVTVWNAF